MGPVTSGRCRGLRVLLLQQDHKLLPEPAELPVWKLHGHALADRCLQALRVAALRGVLELAQRRGPPLLLGQRALRLLDVRGRQPQLLGLGDGRLELGDAAAPRRCGKASPRGQPAGLLLHLLRQHFLGGVELSRLEASLVEFEDPDILDVGPDALDLLALGGALGNGRLQVPDLPARHRPGQGRARGGRDARRQRRPGAVEHPGLPVARLLGLADRGPQLLPRGHLLRSLLGLLAVGPGAHERSHRGEPAPVLLGHLPRPLRGLPLLLLLQLLPLDLLLPLSLHLGPPLGAVLHEPVLLNLQVHIVRDLLLHNFGCVLRLCLLHVVLLLIHLLKPCFATFKLPDLLSEGDYWGLLWGQLNL
mmetsp:Transcript_18194/g.53024  ORF Transcript_18194/g.53024 Transcript_18194/m.53024 type:complete len:362 (-) Transcript_18194:48-1133(-)